MGLCLDRECVLAAWHRFYLSAFVHCSAVCTCCHHCPLFHPGETCYLVSFFNVGRYRHGCGTAALCEYCDSFLAFRPDGDPAGCGDRVPEDHPRAHASTRARHPHNDHFLSLSLSLRPH